MTITMTMTDKMAGMIREASKFMDRPFEISQKDGCTNIVTSSDIAVQDFLCSHLPEIVPGSGFLCEEEHMQDNSFEYTWVIDPIDGTANYSRGIDQCAISVALRHRSEIVAGVVYLPRTDELFCAEKGCGAFRNGTLIHVSEREFADSVLCTALPLYHKEQADRCSLVINDLFHQCNDIRRFGAAAPELCYLAMGRCELFFEYLLSPWDYAAASLILSEAGGVFCSRDGSPLPFDRPSGILAANSPEGLERLRKVVALYM